MGLFSNSASENVYERAKKHLAQKDGCVHIAMFTSFSKLANQNFDCDEKYTQEIDYILQQMQKDGYMIIDVKFNSISGQGLTGNRTGFNTLVTYK